MDSRSARVEAGAAERADAPPRAGPPPDRRQDLAFWLTMSAILGIFQYFNILNVVEERRRGGHPIALWEPAVWETTSGFVVVALAPVIMAFARRVWPVRDRWLPKIVALAAGGSVFSLVHVMAIGVLRWAIYRAVGGHYDLLSPLGDFPYEARKDLFGYAAIVASYVTWRELAARRTAAPAEPDVLEVRDGARRHFVPLSDVVWVEAAGNYVELHRGGGGLLHRASLADMERRLQGAGFVRIHRSRLVRREAIADVESKPTGDFLVRLRDGRELAGSRRYRRPLLAD